MPKFIHLFTHTQYSLLEGACRLKDLFKKTQSENMTTIGMTDFGNLFGMVNFYQGAKKNDLKPIIGAEIFLLDQGDYTSHDLSLRNHVSSLNLFAKNYAGYKNLAKLVSEGSLTGMDLVPRIDKELLKQYSSDLVCTSAHVRGEIGKLILSDQLDAAKKVIQFYQNLFGDDFYLECTNHGLPQEEKLNQACLQLSQELGIELVASNDVYYLDPSEAESHEVLLSIQTQTHINDPNRKRLPNDQYYFKSAAEMESLFDWAPQAIANTQVIADKCNLEINFGEYYLPRFDPPDGKSKDDYLYELCLEGIPSRYGKMTDELQERLDFEFQTIQRMGFVAYFLIVWDFINEAKNMGIPVGPGRGSAAGSLVSYLVGITDLDPLKYDLLFERFLNPDRAGMPDIDIDFCFERRAEVIDYVNEKYGNDKVAQIITFGTLQAKGAIRDVGRALGIPYGEVDRIAKLIPNELGINIAGAIDKEPRLTELMENDRSAKEIIETAQALEGLNRHASIHAAGVVIADKPLTEYVPLYRTSDGQITTAYTMDGIANMGLLKMDFLGLRTLTVVSDAVKLVKKHRNVDIDIGNIPLDDPKTYELLSYAKTLGVFQLESPGMRELLKKLKPSSFEDIIAVLALYRPGPMGSGMLDDFIKRKRGDDEVIYDHEKLEAILKETYGIILYQEQVMKIPVVLAGFTLVQADHLRRAMSKKIQSVMDQMRVDFVKGCQEVSGMTAEKANYIFDLIDYFSGYGFNKSHSAAYAFISYQTAYLKANYPVEFMTAVMSNEKDNTEKVVEYIKESQALGINVLSPSVNRSKKRFQVLDENSIDYGMLALKNVGSSAIESIVKNRQEESYQSIFDLTNRVDLRLVNRKVLESLVKAGAMDEFNKPRSKMMAVIESALERGQKSQKEKASGQFSFFDMADQGGGFEQQEEKYPDIREWTSNQKLSHEKEVLGYYISGHPLDHYQVEIKQFANSNAKELMMANDGDDVCLVGMISKVRLTSTRRTGERMAIVNIEDIQGTIDAVIFPSQFQELAHFLNEGEVVFVRGKVNVREDSIGVIINDLRLIQQVYQSIRAIKVDLIHSTKKVLDELKIKLHQFPGQIPVYLKLKTKANKTVEIQVGKELFVHPNENLMNEIKELIGQKSLTVIF